MAEYYAWKNLLFSEGHANLNHLERSFRIPHHMFHDIFKIVKVKFSVLPLNLFFKLPDLRMAETSLWCPERPVSNVLGSLNSIRSITMG